MSEGAETQLPGYWRFLWLFFMQPVSLRVKLLVLSIIELRPGTESLPLFFRSGFVIVLSNGATFLSILAMRTAGFQVDPARSAHGLAWGLCAGVGLAALAAALSFAFSGKIIPDTIVLGASAALAASTTPTFLGFISNYWVAGFVVSGFFTASICLLVSWIYTPALTPAKMLALGIASGIAPAIGGFIGIGVGGGDVTDCLAFSYPFGVAGVLSGVLTSLRLPIWILESVWQAVLTIRSRVRPESALEFTSVLYHELSFIPIPLLATHLLRTAEHNPTLVRRVLIACAVAPGQRDIGRRTLAQLQARELEAAALERTFSSVSELQGTWLPGREGADPLLLGFADVARYLASVQGASIPFHSLQKLDRAAKELSQLRNRLLNVQEKEHRDLARFLRDGPFPVWEAAISGLRREAEAAAERQLPNPFRAGEPLSPEEGSETFRGREDLIRAVEALLGEPGRGASIALLGPRRCGKTSLLKMLPLLLPDAVCVLFDLQDNPLDSPGSFFTALEKRAREQARRDRQLDLPLLPPGPPFEAAGRWLEALDEAAGDQRILLCLDEFERLETLFPGSSRELLQLLGLLRATVQHRRRIRLLVSGAAPFDELDELWSDHLINVRELRIGHLDEPTAVGLLHKPIPDFPADAVSEGVARAVFARTGGQPYLLQLYGSLLIERLNQEDRGQAAPGDLAWVEKRALEQATYYFRHIPQSAPPAARAALLDLAHGRSVGLDPAARRWLRRRLLLTEDDRLTIPVLGEWIRREEEG